MANEFIIKNGFRSQGDSQVTGSFVNILSPTNLQIQSNLSSSFSVGSTNIAGIGWTPLTLSGSTSAFIVNRNNGFTLSGLVDGNVNIPAFGLNFPLNGVLQTLSTGSDLLNLYSQYTDTTSLGGTPQLSSGLSSTFSGSDGYNLYRFQVYKNLSTNLQSLSIEKINNTGESIQFGLDNSSEGFNIFSTLSQPTSSLFKIYSGSTNLTEFRYDANYIQRPTIIGSDSSTFPSAILQVKGAGTTNTTEALNITDNNNTSLFKVFDNGDTILTGSLSITGGITGSFSGSLSAPGANSQIIFNNAGTLAGANNVYFRTNGRLGIGTDSPLARLGISGSSSDTLLKLDSDSSSSILFVSGSGNVGINTNAPGTRFTVNGDMRLVTPQNSGLLAYDAPTAGSFIWSVTRGTISNDNDINILARNGFAVRTGTTSPTTTGHQFYISNSGSVGIGTITPSASLHISGASSTALFEIDSPALNNIMFVTGSGRVGVGTNAPAYLLDVSGSVRFNGRTHFGTNSSYWLDPFIFSDPYWNAALQIAGGVWLGSSSGKVRVGSYVTPTARFEVVGLGATSATTAFLLQNSSPTNLMTVLDNGQTTFSSPIIALATSQSAFTISQSISASNVVGGQYYGVNITPTFFATTASQTETALRVAATFTGSAAAVGGQNIIADFGATSAGSQFTVTDVTSGSIYMVNDVSGLPIIEATSDWTVNMYNFPNLIFQKTGSQVNIFGTLRVSGSFILPLSQSATPQTGSAYWSGSFLFIYDGTQYRSSSFA
jgi:hypothetical protein